MSDDQNAGSQGQEGKEVPPAPEPANIPQGDPGAPVAVDWQAEAEKWKGVAEANEVARQEALGQVGVRLVQAELRAQAAEAGVQVPEGLALDFSHYLGEDGNPNGEAIGNLVAGFRPVKAEPRFAQDIGIGPQGGGAPARDYSPKAIADRVNQMNPF